MSRSVMQLIFNLSFVILAIAISYCVAYPLLKGYDQSKSRLTLSLDLVGKEPGDFADSYWDVFADLNIYIPSEDTQILGAKENEFLEAIRGSKYYEATTILLEEIENNPSDYRYHLWLAEIYTMLRVCENNLLIVGFRHGRI